MQTNVPFLEISLGRRSYFILNSPKHNSDTDDAKGQGNTEQTQDSNGWEPPAGPYDIPVPYNKNFPNHAQDVDINLDREELHNRIAKDPNDAGDTRLTVEEMDKVGLKDDSDSAINKLAKALTRPRLLNLYLWLKNDGKIEDAYKIEYSEKDKGSSDPKNALSSNLAASIVYSCCLTDRLAWDLVKHVTWEEMYENFDFGNGHGPIRKERLAEGRVKVRDEVKKDPHKWVYPFDVIRKRTKKPTFAEIRQNSEQKYENEQAREGVEAKKLIEEAKEKKEADELKKEADRIRLEREEAEKKKAGGPATSSGDATPTAADTQGPSALT